MTDEKQLQEQADEEMINQGFQELLDSYLATKQIGRASCRERVSSPV